MVAGTEREGRGGVFNSGESAAQVLLEPHLVEVGTKEPHAPEVFIGEEGSPPAVLPTTGREGDLLATKSGDGAGATSTLWFCTKGRPDEPEQRAEWREVLLGPPFEGLG